MRKLLLFLSLVVLGCVSIYAQSKTISGTVIGDDGLPVPGAAVMVKGTTIGTISDIDGNYSFSVPSDAQALVFSFIGLEDLEMPIGDKTVINAVMMSESLEIDEVVAIAYGSVKKSSFSGAATQVNGEKLQKMQVSNLTKGLEGTVAGLQISSSTGTPGSSANIIIRGLGSISSSQEPLIVVDGVPYEGSLNSIATQDIDAVTVLKDAAANSMYGARGSNGVIIVTTKGSRTSNATFNFEARYGFNARGVKNYDIVTSPDEYYVMMYESVRNNLIAEKGYAGACDYASKNLISEYLRYNIYADVPDDKVIDPTTGKVNAKAKKLKWTDDWTEDPFEHGIRQEYNLNVMGGNDNTQAYASLGYLTDEGYLVGSSFDRISGRIKVDQKVGSHVKFGGNVAYSNTKRNYFGTEGSNYSNIFMFSQSIAPIYPIYLYDENGQKMYDEKGKIRYDFGTEYVRPYGSEQNPLAVAKENINEILNDNISTRGYVDFLFLNDFKFSVNGAYDVFVSNQLNYTTPIGGDAAQVHGRAYRYSTRRGALNTNQILTWNHNFFDAIDLSVLAGHEIKNDKYKYFMGHMTNFANPTNPDFSNASTYQNLNSYETEYTLEGLFLKGDFIANDKYFLTASVRRDGSSRFDKDVRWGTFWAVGGSWKVSNEAFMDGTSDWLNFLKAKMSYGTQGNDNIGYTHAYSDLYEVSRVDGEPAFTKVFRGNKDLTWEKSNNFNVGIESRLFDMLTFNADFFIKETKDMLYASPLPVSEGSPTTIYRNEMDMKNTGVEFEISADIIRTRDFKWNVTLNGTHYKNELTKLPEGKPDSGYRAGSYWRKKGGSLYDFYTYSFAGVNPENGAAQYRKYVTDANGVETLSLVDGYSKNEASLCQTGKSSIPDLTGGITTSFEAMGFDFSIATAYQLGGYVSDSFYGELMNPGRKGTNFHKDRFKRWTPNATNATVPALMYENQDEFVLVGDALLTKASYFSIRNITLGYSLPKNLISKVHADRLRIYLTGDNIWLKSARKGLDPRQSFTGSTGYVYSAMSTYSIGINLTF